MTCEAYYQTHPDESTPGFDRCNNRDIEAGTSRAVALLGASTTLFGVLNLFVTGWAIKKFGIKIALLISVFWPAVRLAVQNIGVETGGAKGILIVQCSQIITIIGGPAGYLLALNSFVTEVVEHKERTGALGKLQGCKSDSRLLSSYPRVVSRVARRISSFSWKIFDTPNSFQKAAMLTPIF